MHNNVMFDCIQLDMGKTLDFLGTGWTKKNRKIKTKYKKMWFTFMVDFWCRRSYIISIDFYYNVTTVTR